MTVDGMLFLLLSPCLPIGRNSEVFRELVPTHKHLAVGSRDSHASQGHGGSQSSEPQGHCAQTMAPPMNATSGTFPEQQMKPYVARPCETA